MVTAQTLKNIQEIHNLPHMLVYEFSGAGTLFLTWLHSVAGSSQTVLEACDRYAKASLTSLLSFTPSRFSSTEVAKALAQKAFSRAHELAKLENLSNKPSLGLACTASIVTSKQKQGQHNCYVAISDNLGVVFYELVLQKGMRNRDAEEELVSLLILKALTEYCALEPPSLPLMPAEEVKIHFEPSKTLKNFAEQKNSHLKVSIGGALTPISKVENTAILSGSFNPLHKGHLELAKVAQKQLGKPVDFELPIINAEKADIDLVETLKRTRQFLGKANLYLTQAPLFSDKTTIFPKSTFIVGADTAIRLIETRFYQDSEEQMLASFEILRQAGCCFMVAGRLVKGQFIGLRDINVPKNLKDLFRELPENNFRLDISSGEIRKASIKNKSSLLEVGNKGNIFLREIKVNENIDLCLLELNNAKDLFALVEHNRQYLRQWLPWVDANTKVQDSFSFIKDVQEKFVEGKSLNMGIWHIGKLVGVISYDSIDWENRIGYIGYWLNQSTQGQGIMTISCKALIDYGFKELKLNRIDIRCAVGNNKSCAIPNCLGFTHEGVARQVEWLYNKFVDQNIFSLLASEWHISK